MLIPVKLADPKGNLTGIRSIDHSIICVGCDSPRNLGATSKGHFADVHKYILHLWKDLVFKMQTTTIKSAILFDLDSTGKKFTLLQKFTTFPVFMS